MSLATGIEQPSITMGRFFLILLFGSVIAITGYATEKARLNSYLKFFLHYSVLLTAFSVIFIAADVLSSGSSIFVGIVIFTLVYLVVRGTVALLLPTAKETKSSAKVGKKQEEKKSVYKPIYKD